MSCGCSNTSSITPTTNCGSCGYNCTNCTCSTNPIITPAVVCADPEPCNELFPLECVIYTGPDITCAGTANQLYPALFHYLVLQNSSTTARNFVSILNNINTQLCYLFSKEYISQFLTNIQGDPVLTQLFCDIASSCNCICTLTCPSISNVQYRNNTSAPDQILAGGFIGSTLGRTISFTGSITGTTLTIGAAPSPGTIQVGQKITGPGVLADTYITATSGSNWTVNNTHLQPVSSVSMTASQIEYIVSIYRYFNNSFYYLTQNTFTGNPFAMFLSIELPSQYNNSENLPWLMSVQAVDKIADMLGNPPCTKGYNYPVSNVAVDPSLYVNGYLSCGFGQTTPIPVLECPTICITRFVPNPNTNVPLFEFTFTEPAANPALYHPNSYTIHWYKEINGVFIMQNDQTDIISKPSSGPGSQLTINTTVVVNSADRWAFLITPVFTTQKQCNTSSYFEVRRPPLLSYTSSQLYDKCNAYIKDFTPTVLPTCPNICIREFQFFVTTNFYFRVRFNYPFINPSLNYDVDSYSLTWYKKTASGVNPSDDEFTRTSADISTPTYPTLNQQLTITTNIVVNPNPHPLEEWLFIITPNYKNNISCPYKYFSSNTLRYKRYEVLAIGGDIPDDCNYSFYNI